MNVIVQSLKTQLTEVWVKWTSDSPCYLVPLKRGCWLWCRSQLHPSLPAFAVAVAVRVCRCSVTCCWEWSVGAYYVVSSHLQLTWALCSLPTPGHLDGWCVDVKLSRWLLCLRLSCSGLFRGMELSSGHLHTASCVSELWFCPLHLVDEKDAFQVLFCTLVGLLLE